MPALEHFIQPRPLEAALTDKGELGTQPPTSPRMEQVVMQLAAGHGVNLSQPGVQLTLDQPDHNRQWLIANLDGERISVTRFQVHNENLLSPDIDMVFAVTEYGWEPREIVYAEGPWDEFAQTAQEQELTVFDEQGDLQYDVFTEVWALAIEQEGQLEQTRKIEDPENFIWTEDLSPNGQRLWLYLIGEGGVIEFLQSIASEEAWDLEAAIKELEEHRVLDRSFPGRIRIIRKYRGYD